MASRAEGLDSRVPMRRQLRLSVAVLSLGILTAAGAAGFAAGGSTDTVKPGDSRWAISHAHGLTVDQLARANHLNPANYLLIGTRLYIPGSAGTSVGHPAASPSRHAANPWTFCSTFQPSGGPVGVLPDLLQQSP